MAPKRGQKGGRGDARGSHVDYGNGGHSRGRGTPGPRPGSPDGQRRAPRDRQRREWGGKHRFCAAFHGGGGACRRGDQCEFAHDRREFVGGKLFQPEDEDIATASPDFFVNQYKTEWCPYGHNHNWDECSYAHNHNDARRNPAMGYSSKQCPDWSEKNDKGPMEYESRCPRGVLCQYAHGPKEALYHPEKYKTSACHSCRPRDGQHRSATPGSSDSSRCNRGPLCAFYHSRAEQRPAGGGRASPPLERLESPRMQYLQPRFMQPPFQPGGQGDYDDRGMEWRSSTPAASLDSSRTYGGMDDRPDSRVGRATPSDVLFSPQAVAREPPHDAFSPSRGVQLRQPQPHRGVAHIESPGPGHRGSMSNSLYMSPVQPHLIGPFDVGLSQTGPPMMPFHGNGSAPLQQSQPYLHCGTPSDLRARTPIDICATPAMPTFYRRDSPEITGPTPARAMQVPFFHLIGSVPGDGRQMQHQTPQMSYQQPQSPAPRPWSGGLQHGSQHYGSGPHTPNLIRADVEASSSSRPRRKKFNFNSEGPARAHSPAESPGLPLPEAVDDRFADTSPIVMPLQGGVVPLCDDTVVYQTPEPHRAETPMIFERRVATPVDAQIQNTFLKFASESDHQDTRQRASSAPVEGRNCT
mmetsp:Transcript_8128/g.17667  ORF Transcript_8128/g.17667 Transcript_8128/m.17667 type:complete len:636 (+) Transcript_8128:133-2040(+)